MRENLIICPVGDRSSHAEWLKGARNFDIMLIYYGDKEGRYAHDGEYYLECREIGKLQKIAVAIKALKEKVKEYDAIAFADDDLKSTAEQFNLLFEKFKEYDLDAAQPAIDHGFITYRLTTRHADCELRYVHFIETMCPVFKTSLLLNELFPTLTINKSSWGVDFLWAEMLEDKRVAILDNVPMRHKDLISTVRSMISNEMGNYYRVLSDAGISEMEECEEVVSHIDARVMENLFVEKSRIPKPLGRRIILLPRVVYDHLRWSIFLWLRKYLPRVYARYEKLMRIFHLKRSIS
jgi:hypothetical protein